MLRSRKKRRRSVEFSRRKKLILPQELIAEILYTLPAESLVRFQCVSKAWFSLINDPYFIKMHLHTNRQRILIGKKRKSNRWPEEHNLVKISNEDRLGYPVKIFPPLYRSENVKYRTSVTGSCNGLVCIVFFCNRKYGSHDDQIVIWNPSIRKHKKVPFNPVEEKHRLGGLGDGFHFAFGYDPVNNDYKLLKIIKFVGLKYDRRSKVYSMKANSWRRLEDQLPYKERFTISSPQPVFTNGAFHWLVESITGARTLLTMDLTTEKFEVQTLPFKLHSLGNLVVLEGSLCVSAYTQARDIDFWMMKEYGVTSSWSRLCMVPATFFYRQPLAISRDGKKVLLEDDKLFWYDIKKKTFMIVEHISSKYNWTTTYVESLFLLDGDSDN
jgi:F-box interacting protein